MSHEIRGAIIPQSIDLSNLINYLTNLLAKSNKPKRSVKKHINSNDYITLYHQNIACSCDNITYSNEDFKLDSSSINIEGFKTLSVTVNLKFSKTESDTIELWALPSYMKRKKRKAFLICLIQLPSENIPLLSSEFRFFHSRLRKKSALNLENPHLENLSLQIDNDSHRLSLYFELIHGIKLQQSMNAYNSVLFIHRLRDLASFIMTPNLTLYQKAGCDNDQDEKIFENEPTEESFYSLITNNTARCWFDEYRKPLTLPGLSKKLIGFQSQTLEWSLLQEGYKLDLTRPESDTEKPQFKAVRMKNMLSSNDPIDDELLSKALDDFCFGFTRVQLNDHPTKYWYNMYTGNICSSEYAVKYLRGKSQWSSPAQALLSEEMGLGKTIETIGLILMNPRQKMNDFNDKKLDTFSGERFLSECKTTLIICPQTIIGQWFSEIREASDLTVMIYEGISLYDTEARKNGEYLKPESVAKDLSNYDIILVSYKTISKELHRAVFMPSRRPKRRCTKRLKFFDPTVEYDYSGLAHTVADKSNSADGDDDEYERIDYSSPLMLLEFWRVVLDEVQMTSSISTNAAKFARIIPRVHSWGVSGTLIKDGLDDLYSLLRFLRLEPISRFGGNSPTTPWKILTKTPPFYQFGRLFKQICLRHTKKMVSNQIQLPSQSRIMLKAPFTSIERDNYDFLFNQFLTQVGLDENGNPTVEDYDPSRNYSSMRRWLVKLRQVCCHAQLGRPIYSKKRGGEDGNKANGLVVGTLSEVLSGLIIETRNKFTSNERQYYSLQLDKGKIYEFLREPSKSMELFEQVIPEIESQISALKSVKREDTADSSSSTHLRIWLELLHQAYFLLASSHYQHYQPMNPLPDNFKDLVASEIDENENRLEIDTALLNKDQLKHWKLENEYYAKADSLLMEILQDPLLKVQQMTGILTDKFNLIHQISIEKALTELRKDLFEITEFKDDNTKLFDCSRINDLDRTFFYRNMGFDPQTALFYDRAKKAISELNVQSYMIDTWITKLYSLLIQPVSNNVQDKVTGEEYGDTLVNQEMANTYLEILQKTLDDRQHSILSIEGIPQYERERIRSKASANNTLATTNKELYIKLDKLRKKYMPDGCFNTKYTLKHLWLESTNIELDIRATKPDLVRLMKSTVKILKDEFNRQKKDVEALKTKTFNTLEDVFNAKVDYFKALQVKSDALIKYIPKNTIYSNLTPAQKAQKDLGVLNQQLIDLKGSINMGKIRLKYLNSLLIPTHKVDNDNEDDKSTEKKICVICRSEILVGILTSCGHQYCRDCLMEWMKNKHTCPVCKRKLNKSDLYVFTRTRKKLKGEVIKAHKPEKDEDMKDEMGKFDNARLMDKEIFKVYKSLDNEMLREIMNVPLKESYGAKVDMIVRQAIFIKNHDKSSQILVFSQWSEFLKILAQSMKRNGVKFLSSTKVPGQSMQHTRRGKRSEDNSIERFKKNPEITCYLLNAKAQAAGLTLTNASHVFLCEPLVNLSLELQAISRIHRIGQTRPTTIWNFIIEDTVEESIAYLSTKKRLQFAKNGDKSSDEYVDEDAMGVTELTKGLDKLVDKNDGEIIGDDELWASFFASRSPKIIESVVENTTTTAVQ